MPATRPPTPLDWNDVRVFLALARERTLARAAAALGVDQTTVGRRIAAFEGRMRVPLFSRSTSGFVLTAAGAGMLEAAQRMEEGALELAGVEGGYVTATSGTVRVATTGSLAEHFVVPAVVGLRQRHPAVQVIVDTAPSRVDLRKGEADMAVRLVKPADPRLAFRKLAAFELRLYASAGYVAKHGAPTSLTGHSLVAYEEAVRTGSPHPFAKLATEASSLVLLSNDHHALLTAARCDLGIVQMPSYVGERSELVRVLPEAAQPYSVWMVVPQSRRRLAAVRALGDAIIERFGVGPSGTAGPLGRSPARGERSAKAGRRRP